MSYFAGYIWWSLVSLGPRHSSEESQNTSLFTMHVNKEVFWFCLQEACWHKTANDQHVSPLKFRNSTKFTHTLTKTVNVSVSFGQHTLM